ncbi:MAG: hypothetical protein AB7R55_05465 [Gemmatimonadales bacterium]
MDMLKRKIAPWLIIGVALGAGCSDEPNPIEDDTPDPPGNVTVTATSAVTAQISFTPVSGATGHILERAEGASGTFAQIATPTTSPYDDTGLTPLATYRYRLKTISGSKQSDYSSVASVTLPDRALQVVTADISANTTWTNANRYRLQGFIHVANGATLTIEKGTTIEGDFATVGSSLFVLRGAKIDAQGTADEPIVFTSSQPVGSRQAGDWGGLIIIGNGIVNRSPPVILEGSGTGANNPALDYAGGTDNTDNSGILKYVRIEFAGFATAPDAELNTLTLAAVGSGTQIDFVQSLNGLDDSFEFFGGAVDAKHLVSYNSGDDHFDISEGYVGRLQHLIAYQNVQVVPRPQAGNISSDPQGIENDGCAGSNCTNGQASQPFNVPVVANFTLVGPPASVTSSSGGIGMMLRRGTGGFYVNGVVARWSRAAISLRDQETLNRNAGGLLELKNLLLGENAVTFQPQTGTTVQGTVDLAANSIQEGAAAAAAIFSALPASPADANTLDWTPASGSEAATGGLATFTGELATRAGTVVTGTAYRGAADPSGAKWWAGWTRYAEN